MPKFRPHGETTITVRDRVFVLRTHSDLNEEEMQRLLGEIARLRRDFSAGPWGIMIVVVDAVLLTTVAEQQAQLAFPGLVAAGLGAFVLVVPELPERPLIEAQVTRVVGDSTCPMKFVLTEAEATAWLAEHLD